MLGKYSTTKSYPYHLNKNKTKHFLCDTASLTSMVSFEPRLALHLILWSLTSECLRITQACSDSLFIK